jgi:hypothetical protein
MTRTAAASEPFVAFQYIETTLSEGITIDEYRHGRPHRPTRWQRLKHLAGASTAPTAAAGATG